MSKTRDNYQVTGNSISEVVSNLNFLLQRFADRIDKLEGIRGTASIESDLDLNSNSLIDAVITTLTGALDVGGAVAISGALTVTGNAALGSNVTVTGTLGITGNVTMTNDLTVSGDTQVVGLDSTGGFTFTDAAATVLHQMGGV